MILFHIYLFSDNTTKTKYDWGGVAQDLFWFWGMQLKSDCYIMLKKNNLLWLKKEGLNDREIYNQNLKVVTAVMPKNRRNPIPDTNRKLEYPF